MQAFVLTKFGIQGLEGNIKNDIQHTFSSWISNINDKSCTVRKFVLSNNDG